LGPSPREHGPVEGFEELVVVVVVGDVEAELVGPLFVVVADLVVEVVVDGVVKVPSQSFNSSFFSSYSLFLCYANFASCLIRPVTKPSFGIKMEVGWTRYTARAPVGTHQELCAISWIWVWPIAQWTFPGQVHCSG